GEIAPEIDPKILLLPVIDLDQVLQNRVSSLVPNLFTGGHHVPGHAQKASCAPFPAGDNFKFFLRDGRYFPLFLA
ncbi:MAG: hypothetical protein Q8O74_06640, partial [bacterium]|nr:hypothetical protein [bacterium]